MNGRAGTAARTRDSPAPGLRSAIGWSYVLTGGRLGASTLVTFVLAAVLGPAVLGLATMAMVFVTAAQVVLQQGLIAAIVQRAELRRQHLDAAFWVVFTTGVAMTAVMAALSTTWAAVNRLPELGPLCLALTPLLLLQGLAVVPEALLRRRMRFRALAVRSLLSVLCGGVTGVVLAATGFGVWSLVAQQLVTAAVDVAVLWTAVLWRPRLFPRFRAVRDLVGFSAHSAGAGLGVLVGNRADVLVMGAFFGPLAVGLYRLATRIVDLVVEVSVRSLQQVSLPELSRLQSEPRAFARRLATLQRLGAMIGLPALGVLAAVAEPGLSLLGGDWLQALDALRILCLVGAVNVYGVLLGPALQAAGRPGLLSLMAWLRAVLGMAGFAAAGYLLRGHPVAVQAVGIAVVALGLQAVVTVVMTHVTLRRVLRTRYTTVLWPTLPAVLAGGAAWGTSLLLGRAGIDRAAPLLELFVYGSIASAVAVLVLLLTDTGATALAARTTRRRLRSVTESTSLRPATPRLRALQNVSCEDMSMSQSADHGLLNTLGSQSTQEPEFELAIRGYDRRQVDRYVDRLVSENGGLLSERDEIYNQAQALAGQVQQLQTEMAELRRRSVTGDRASYRHLGPRVEQILTLAEDEASYLKKRAANEAAQQREEAARILSEAEAEAGKARQDFERTLASRRAEEERADADRRAKVDAYVTEKTAEAQRMQRDAQRAQEEAGQRATKVRDEAQAQAEALRRAAQEEVKKIRDDAAAYALKVRSDAEQHANTLTATTEHQVAEMRTATEFEVSQLREETVAEMHRLRSTAKREAEQVRGEAEQQARTVTEKAAREAEQMRAEAKAEVADVRSGAEQQATKITAQASERARQIVDGARKEADGIFQAARVQAEQIVGDAQRRVSDLETQRREIRRDLRHLRETIARLSGSSALLDDDLNDDPDDDLDGPSDNPVGRPAAEPTYARAPQSTGGSPANTPGSPAAAPVGVAAAADATARAATSATSSATGSATPSAMPETPPEAPAEAPAEATPGVTDEVTPPRRLSAVQRPSAHRPGSSDGPVATRPAAEREAQPGTAPGTNATPVSRIEAGSTSGTFKLVTKAPETDRQDADPKRPAAEERPRPSTLPTARTSDGDQATARHTTPELGTGTRR